MRVFIFRRLIRFVVTLAVFQIALFLVAYVLSGGLAAARQAPAAAASTAQPQATAAQASPAATEAEPTQVPAPADEGEPEFEGELAGLTADQLEMFGESIPQPRSSGAEAGATAATQPPAATAASAEGAVTAEPVQPAAGEAPAPLPPSPAANALQWLIVPTVELLRTRAPRTLVLFLPATLAGFGLGQALGKRIAWRRGGLFELGVSLTGVAFYTSFAPWLAFILINIFALSLRWVPVENLITTNLWTGGEAPDATTVIAWLLLTLLVVGALLAALWWITRRVSDLHPVRVPFGPEHVVNGRTARRVTTSRPAVRLLGALAILALTLIIWNISGWDRFALDMLHHLILPLATLTLLSFGETMLLMRTAMLETLGADHVPTAWAMGLPDAAVRDQHVARLALLPVLARFVLQLPFVLIGSMVIEPMFAWGGIGQALFDAAGNQQLPVVVGILSVVGVLALTAHPIVDILHAWLDPRVRDAAIRPSARA